MENDKPLEKVDLNSFTSEHLKELVKAGIINEQGLRISGQGIIIEALKKVKEETNKTNKQLYFVEKNILEKASEIVGRLDNLITVEKNILEKFDKLSKDLNNLKS